MLVKMPHNNFKERCRELNTGAGKCPCGQTFEYTSTKRYENEASNASQILFQSSKGFYKIGILKKATTLREQQLNEAERMHKVHN